jgi:hypothetical protein
MTITAKLARNVMDTAKLKDEQLLELGFTREEIDAGQHLPTVGGGASNSTQLITDMNSALALTLTPGEIASGVAAAGPLQDLTAQMKSVLLNFQEAAAKLNYLLAGTQIAAASLTAPVGGPIVTGDNGIYNLLVGIYQILK